MGYKIGKAGFSDNLKYLVGRNVKYVQLHQNITDEQSIIKTMFKMDTINVVVMRGSSQFVRSTSTEGAENDRGYDLLTVRFS